MKRYSAAIIAVLGLAWLAADATRDTVAVLGHRVDLPCAMRQLFGVPCPGCGMTRSVLLTLHGHLADAIAVNPVGPVFVVGLVVLAAALATGRAWRAAGVYGGVTAALLLVNWVAVLAGR